MRIIGGRFRRRTIVSPQGEGTRPTTDRTREAIFNIVASRLDLDEVSVLDLFAGSGALGLEAMSRGAGSVVFVDFNPDILQVAKDNALKLEADLSCQFVRQNVFSFLKGHTTGRYTLILADPPYGLPDLQRLTAMVLPLLREDGLFVLEHDSKEQLEEHAQRVVSRVYGKSAVTVYAGRAADAP